MIGIDGTEFDFVGRPHALHRFYSRGQIKVYARLTPVGWTPEGGDPPEGGPQYISGVDIHVGDAKFVVLCDGTSHVVLPDDHITITSKVDTLDAPGHPGSTSDEPHPLQGVPHMNVTIPILPAARLGESGILVDGPDAAKDPGRYVVPG